jgi:hypothetical protein
MNFTEMRKRATNFRARAGFAKFLGAVILIFTFGGSIIEGVRVDEGLSVAPCYADSVATAPLGE